MKELIASYGMEVVQAYMLYIQENAELAVREMLKEIAAGIEVCYVLYGAWAWCAGTMVCVVCRTFLLFSRHHWGPAVCAL